MRFSEHRSGVELLVSSTKRLRIQHRHETLANSNRRASDTQIQLIPCEAAAGCAETCLQNNHLNRRISKGRRARGARFSLLAFTGHSADARITCELARKLPRRPCRATFSQRVWVALQSRSHVPVALSFYF